MYKLFASSLIAAAAYAQEDVSRLGKDIKMVIVLSNGGVEYPSHNFGLAVDPAMNNTGVPGELTPLGQRQQFLIGSELRTRYVDESRTLLFDYYVPQTYLQTAFKQSSILSL